MLQYEQKKGTGQKRPGYAQLQKLFGPAYGLGSPGPNFCFSPQPPQPGETGDWVYMLYGREKPLGRGFCLHIQPDFSLFQLVTPLPTTGHDLDDFFAVAAKLGGYLGQGDFLTEERQTFPVEGMEVFRDEMKGDNCLMVKDFADERPGFAVSGVLYPLHMGEVFCLRLAQMDPVAAEQAFSQCLGQKQTGGYYYLNPNFYRNTETGEAFAIYALSEGVASIIPKEPFIPYGEGPFGAEPVHTWKLALIQNGAETGVLATLPYADFLAALRAGEAQEFDEKHLLLKGLALPRLRQLALLGEVSGA